MLILLKIWYDTTNLRVNFLDLIALTMSKVVSSYLYRTLVYFESLAFAPESPWPYQRSTVKILVPILNTHHPDSNIVVSYIVAHTRPHMVSSQYWSDSFCCTCIPLKKAFHSNSPYDPTHRIVINPPLTV